VLKENNIIGSRRGMGGRAREKKIRGKIQGKSETVIWGKNKRGKNGTP